MAHKVIDGNCIVDWVTGDPEGDRKHLFKAYRDFLKELKENCKNKGEISKCFTKWRVAPLDIDDFPRISIKRPEEKK